MWELIYEKWLVMMLFNWVYLLIAYGLGCMSTAYYWIQIRYSSDVRAQGSGNSGARNAGRLYGKSAFFIAFAGDAGKAALAMLVAHVVTGSLTYELLVLLFVLLGHIYPAQLQFKGGKGMASFGGGLFVLDWRIGLMMLGVALLGLILFRKFTPAGLIAVASFPCFIYFIHGQTLLNVLWAFFITLLVLHAHRSNIIAFVRR
jgi:glycerol-3-phosphate acyltransferase PlsY